MSTGGAVERSEISAPALGMVLFISSEVMFFAGLFAAYFTIRGRAGEWPPAGAEVEIVLPAVATALLLASSVTMHRAEGAARDGEATGRWLGITLLLGVAFLVVQGVEYAGLGFRVADHSYGTLFYSMTGFHGLHVAGGLAAIALVSIKNARGHLSDGRHGPVTAVSYYWHFVDVVWVALFATLYLLR